MRKYSFKLSRLQKLNKVINSSRSDLPADLTELVQSVHSMAQSRAGNVIALLELLRLIDELHYEVRDTLFHEALPNGRQQLYQLLRDIEQNGGWPHIKRMRLTDLLDHLEEELNEAEDAEDPSEDRF